MRLRSTRDSVAAGDDADAPHEGFLDLPDGARLADLLAAVTQAGVPASVQGGSTWAVRLAGRIVAVVSELTGEPLRVHEVGDPSAPVVPGAELHWQYLTNADGGAVAGAAREDPARDDLRARFPFREHRRPGSRGSTA